MLGANSKAIGAIVGTFLSWAVVKFGLPSEWASNEMALAVTTIITAATVWIFPKNVQS